MVMATEAVSTIERVLPIVGLLVMGGFAAMLALIVWPLTQERASDRRRDGRDAGHGAG